MPDNEEIHARACENHQKAAEKYIEARTTAYASFFNLLYALDDARRAAIDSGALTVDDEGNVQTGWYSGTDDPKRQSVGSVDNRGVAAAGGAAGLAGGIGAPMTAWMLVGAFGTASTGTAIGSLSGAAATSATAAWFGGGAVAAGGLGMAALLRVLADGSLAAMCNP